MTTDFLLSIDRFWASLGTGTGPALIDARIDEDFAADPRLVPGAVRRPGLDAAEWAAAYAGGAAVVYCERGLKISQGAAAWLRACGADARSLAGGFRAWRDAGLPLVNEASLPSRDRAGRTVWVAGRRATVDRFAVPWLIRRFVDPGAVFLFVEAEEVAPVAARFGAVPFGGDGPGFAELLARFGLETEAFGRFAESVDGGAPEAAGLRALASGLFASARGDADGLETGLAVCDAFYRWCRDGEEGALR